VEGDIEGPVVVGIVEVSTVGDEALLEDEVGDDEDDDAEDDAVVGDPAVCATVVGSGKWVVCG